MLVRDGAVAGLSYLADQKSVFALEAARAREPHEELKGDITEVIQLLQDTAEGEMLPSLKNVFALAAGEDFEDGVETEFSRQVEGFVKQYDIAGVKLIGDALARGLFPEQYLAEALLWIGDMEHEATRNERRELLESALDSESVFIFDASVSALSYLGDPSCIPLLEKKLEEESFQPIRVNIENTLSYLRKLTR